jgi:hypothetical protein
MKKLSWRALNEQLSTLTEEEVFALLTAERSTHRRANYLQRLHQRYCAMRDSRERIEILKEAVRP